MKNEENHPLPQSYKRKMITNLEIVAICIIRMLPNNVGLI